MDAGFYTGLIVGERVGGGDGGTIGDVTSAEGSSGGADFYQSMYAGLGGVTLEDKVGKGGTRVGGDVVVVFVVVVVVVVIVAIVVDVVTVAADHCVMVVIQALCLGLSILNSF